MNDFGYIAAVSFEGKRAAVLELKCASPHLADSAEFQELAQKLCETAAIFAPRWLSVESIPEKIKESLLNDCRHEAIKRGIPKDDSESYALNLFSSTASKICLLSQTIDGVPASEIIACFSKNHGSIHVSRFYCMNIDQ
ncbi:MAG: hypothetical protein K6G50_01710 [bacterium]|nr:hypothetical protein [bacterium]